MTVASLIFHWPRTIPNWPWSWKHAHLMLVTWSPRTSWPTILKPVRTEETWTPKTVKSSPDSFSYLVIMFISVSMLNYGLITDEHEKGPSKWQVPVSTWVNRNMTEDWDEGIINNSQLVPRCFVCVWIWNVQEVMTQTSHMFVCRVLYCRGGWGCSSIRVGCEWQVSCLLQQCAAALAGCLSTFCLFFSCCVFIALPYVFLQIRDEAHQQSWFKFQITKLPPMVRILSDFVLILRLLCVYMYIYVYHTQMVLFLKKFLICTK